MEKHSKNLFLKKCLGEKYNIHATVNHYSFFRSKQYFRGTEFGPRPFAYLLVIKILLEKIEYSEDCVFYHILKPVDAIGLKFFLFNRHEN